MTNDDPYGYGQFPDSPLRIPPHQVVAEEPSAEVLEAVRDIVANQPNWASVGPHRMEVRLRHDYGITATVEQVAGALAEVAR